MKNILIVVAHADDEAIGCGATIAKHIKNGDCVALLVMTDGVSSRDNTIEIDKTDRESNLQKAAQYLGISTIYQYDFPDNQLDTISLLTLTKSVEQAIAKFSPSVIYTHFSGDLNIDHRLTHQAVLIASRPQPGQSVKSILCFEIQSSTEWTFDPQNAFNANYFVDVSGFELNKKALLGIYKDEMREPPHSRSIKNIMNNLAIRGASIGCNAAEAFMVARITE